MQAQGQVSTGPNPYCEVGRTHPRDRHRMRPVEGQAGVWACARHGLFARVVETEVAANLGRGDDFTMHDGAAGVVVRAGDERQGGVLLYYRAKE